MKEDIDNLQPSIAQVMFKRACELIPDLENPERIKPSFKDRFTWEYSEQFKKYDYLSTLNRYFLGAIGGDNESKEYLALWLLKGIKNISGDFYENYGDNPTDSKSLLKTHIELLLNEYLNDPDPELDIDANVLLEDIDYYVKKW